jgi:type II secretory pathway component PulF
MTAYRYEAARQDGAVVAGVIDAESTGHATVVLAGRGLFPIALTAAVVEDRRPAASRRDLAIAFRGIAALVGAGVPLDRALAATEPIAARSLRHALASARAALREGHSLAQALTGTRGVVPPVVIGMVRAGERGSRLAEALDQAAVHLEQEADLVARVRQALAYPLLLAVAGTTSVLVIGTVIVPRFAELLGDLGGELPGATRVLLGGSRFLAHWWVPLALGVVGGAVAAVAWARRPGGRSRLHGWLQDLPLVGPIRLSLATTRAARALGAMLGTGMPLLAALDGAGDATADQAVAERIRRARERVASGASLTDSLGRERAVTPLALQLVAVGESSGRLAEMTRRAGDLAAQESERALRTLVTLLEPALIVAFGGLVAFVAAALLQAVYSVRPM